MEGTEHARINSHQDGCILAFSNDGRSAADVAAMDDMQFMDALMEHESAFVDSSEPDCGPHLRTIDGMMNPQSTSFLPSMENPLTAAQQKVGYGEDAGSSSERLPQQNFLSQQELLSKGYIAQGSIMPFHHSLHNGEGALVTQSSLTARLLHPYTLSSNNPSFPVSSTIAPSTNVPSKKSSKKKSDFLACDTPEDPNTKQECKKRSRQWAPPISEDEDEKVKRRIDRNQREQIRSQKITEQIGCLKALLSSANVHFKPDKHSTLITVTDYIMKLQARSQLLDLEHKNLIDTIAKTNEIVNAPHYRDTEIGETIMTNDLLCDGPTGSVLEADHAVFVRDLDYKNVFRQCTMPLAVASIDGRLIDCNLEFELLTGYDRQELIFCDYNQPQADSVQSYNDLLQSSVTISKNLSLFNLLCRDDMEKVFLAMSCMLKQPITAGDAPLQRHIDFWSGRVKQSRRMNEQVSMQ
jgi:PAS domain-containing protein